MVKWSGGRSSCLVVYCGTGVSKHMDREVESYMGQVHVFSVDGNTGSSGRWALERFICDRGSYLR